MMARRSQARFALVVAGVTAVTFLAWSPTRPAAAATTTAVDALATLTVAPDQPVTGYTRDAFGVAWTDDNDAVDGNNGCDTRDDILRRDLVDSVTLSGTNGCNPATGQLADPYQAQTINFVHGDGSIQIDHVVSLANAWATGAANLSERARQNIANDPRTCWRWTPPPMRPRAMPMLLHGCRLPPPTPVRTSRGRSPSRSRTG